MSSYAIEWFPLEYSVLRMAPGSRPVLPEGPFFRAILHSENETTVVAPESYVSPLSDGERSGPWRLLRLVGPLPHDAVGILAGLSEVLAQRAVPIFALSTADTDYILVPSDRAGDADDALRRAGYTVPESP